MEPIESRILEALDAAPKPANVLAKELGIPLRDIRSHLSILTVEGSLVRLKQKGSDGPIYGIAA